MSAAQISQIEDLQAQLERAHALALEIQRVALDTNTADAEEGLNLIDALSDAMGHRLAGMIADADGVGRWVGRVMLRCDALSDELASDAAQYEGT
ncbi:hypothetical protein [Salipiger sp.]|uniref:hypothetical protein n=1 Tax=Salipiger sp. TaxID=2078585 RepID=UPI003A97E3E9